MYIYEGLYMRHYSTYSSWSISLALALWGGHYILRLRLRVHHNLQEPTGTGPMRTDRPCTGSLFWGRKVWGRKVLGTKSVGTKSVGTKSFGDEKFWGPKFGHEKFEDEKFGDEKFWERKVGDEMLGTKCWGRKVRDEKR